MSKYAYSFPDDFSGWQFMHKTPSGYSIYFSPDNMLAMMLDDDEKTVLIVSDRRTESPIYENREKIQESAARNFPKTSLDIIFHKANLELRPVVRRLV